VVDHETVKAGQLLAVIDDRDEQVEVAAAQANVATAQAAIDSLHAQRDLQQSAIAQAEATLKADAASLQLAQQNLKRYQNMAHDGSGTVQDLQRAATELSTQQAAELRDRAAAQAAHQKLAVIDADQSRAGAALEAAKAALDAAQLKLSYTRINAPIAGVVGQRSLREGAYVQVGQPLLAIVPLDAVYVMANYRETQLANVAPGQSVTLSVDALPGLTFQGKVDSLGPASAVSFSPIAPHNATGNFTKIVQRLPVKIVLTPGQTGLDRLRVGMSVEPRIQTGH